MLAAIQSPKEQMLSNLSTVLHEGKAQKNTNLGGSQNYTAMTMGAVIAIVNGAIHKTTSTTIHYTEHDANEYSIAYEQTGTNKAAGIDLNSQKTLM